jgi:hypothetical protein
MTIGQRGHALVPAMHVSPGARKIAGLRECESFDLQSEKSHLVVRCQRFAQHMVEFAVESERFTRFEPSHDVEKGAVVNTTFNRTAVDLDQAISFRWRGMAEAEWPLGARRDREATGTGRKARAARGQDRHRRPSTALPGNRLSRYLPIPSAERIFSRQPERVLESCSRFSRRRRRRNGRPRVTI